MTLRTLTAAAALLALPPAMAAGFDRAAFETPDNVFSPAFFWLWGDHLKTARLVAEVDDMYAHWSRSLCIHPYPKNFRPGTSDMEPDYLTEEYFRIYGEILEHAAAKGVVSWLYDEGGWPSGSACGRVLAADPERFAQRYMAPGRKIETYVGNPKVSAPYPSVIERGATETFIRMTHDEYARRFSRHFGKAIRFAFTDEPALPSRNPGKWLPWCSDFEAVFRARKGYDIAPHLDDLLSMTNRSDAVARVRVDYRDVLSQLFLERYLLPIRDWCRSHGLKSGGHLNGEHDFMGNARYGFGHILRALRALDVPGVDIIWRQLWPGDGPDGRQLPFPKYASSAAHQNGAPYVLAEAYAIYGLSVKPAEAQWLLNYLLVRGCNMFVISSYQPWLRGAGMYNYPSMAFGPANPQWDCQSDFLMRATRLCALLAQGRPAQDVAVLHDVRAAWALGPDAQEAERRHYDVARALQEGQRDFDFVDDDQLAEAEIVRDGPALAIGKMRYLCVVLPTAKWMRAEARAKLDAFRAAGGKVVEGDDFSSVPQTCRVTGTGAQDIRVMKRVEDGGQALYFLVNEAMERRTVQVALAEKGPLVQADPGTGAWTPLASRDGAFTWNVGPGEALAVLAGVAASEAARPACDGRTVTLDGTWEMSVRRRVGPGPEEVMVADTPDAPFVLGRLGDWRPLFGEEFSGRIAYRTAFESPTAGAAELDLGEVHNCCSVRLNGKDVGMRYAPPHRFRVELAKGTNVLEVTVANSLANALAPTPVQEYVRKRFSVNKHYASYAEKFNVLGHESGLYGPVRLTFGKGE